MFGGGVLYAYLCIVKRTKNEDKNENCHPEAH